MTKPILQNLWNDLNESYSPNSPNIFLAYCTRKVVKRPSINFFFFFFFFLIPWEKQNSLLNLVEDPAIWEQGKKDSLCRDKRHDLVFFLMYNRFLNWGLSTKWKISFINSGNTPVLDLIISVASNGRFFGEQ